MKHRSHPALGLPILIALLLYAGTAHAQQGTWLPPGADTARPRTMLTPAELELLRTQASYSTFEPIFLGVYANARGTTSTDNATSNGRRARATSAKNAAFVLMFGRKPRPHPQVTDPHDEQLNDSDRIELREKVLGLLNTVNTDVPAITLTNLAAYDDWQWRSKDLIDYLIAYDLMLGTGVDPSLLATARTRLRQYAGNLYRESTRRILGVSFFDVVKNNHALMSAGALGMAAVVLNDVGGTDTAERPERWAQAALWNIDNVLWRDAARQSEPDLVAGYAEGPHYMRYAFLNLLPFFRALNHFVPAEATFSVSFNGTVRNVRHPWHDPNYTLLYGWLQAVTLPNGLLPPLEDTFVNEAFPELALAENVDALVHRQCPITATGTTLSDQLNSTVDMRANYLAAGRYPRPHDSHSSVQPAAGDIVLAAGDGDAGNYLHVGTKHGAARTAGAGHNQADDMSFLLYGAGEMLALDPGYLKYDRRNEVGKATDHNMVLVDGTGPAIGSPGNPGGADVFATSWGMLRSLAFAEARTSYGGADLTRAALLTNGYFVIADFSASPTDHRYTWQLHGNGRGGNPPGLGTFSGRMPDGYWRWQIGTAVLDASVDERGGDARFDTVPGKHEFAYDSAATHTALRVESSPGTSTEFLAVLMPHTTERNPPGISRSTISDSSVTSFFVTTERANDVVMVTADTLGHAAAGPAFAGGAQVITDARLLHASTTHEGRLNTVLMREGTGATVGGLGRLNAAPRMNAAFERFGPLGNSYGLSGWCDRAGSISIKLPDLLEVTGVTGPHVTRFTYDRAEGTLRVDTDSGTVFDVSFGIVEGAPEPSASGATAFENIRTDANGMLVASIHTGNGRRIALHVMDMLGRRVAERSAVVGGDAVLTVPLGEAPSGMYLCMLYADGIAVETRKVTLIR